MPAVTGKAIRRVASLRSNFPAGLLTRSVALQADAASILGAIRSEVESLGQEAITYFDTSRPRYELCLALALEEPVGRVLDLGCSPGHMSMALTKAGFDVWGLDLNENWLVKYSPGWAERLRVRQASLEEEPIPEEDESFDLVIFTEVLEHIAVTHPKEVLKEIHRVLKPGGRLILSTPNVANVSNLLALGTGENIFWDPSIFYGSVDRHNREYTPRELVTLLETSPFQSFDLGYANTWSNWNAATASIVQRVLPVLAKHPRLRRHPLFNNTLFVRATA